jgi:hypothetical protein
MPINECPVEAREGALTKISSVNACQPNGQNRKSKLICEPEKFDPPDNQPYLPHRLRPPGISGFPLTRQWI